MKKIFILFILSLFISGCAGSPIVTSWQAGQHTRAMLNLQLNMTPQEVMDLMGKPQKTEMYRGKSGEAILVYMYVTEGKDIRTRRWSKANYTPLIFVDNKLTGWGWSYLNGTATKYEFIIKNLY